MTTSTPFPWVRLAVRHALIWALVAAALVGIVSALSGSFTSITWNAFATITLFAVFALISWYDADVSARRAKWFGIASASTSIFLLIYGVARIWTPNGTDNMFGLSWFYLLVIARVALLHVHLLLTIFSRFTTPLMNKISKFTVIMVAVLVFHLTFPVFAGWKVPEFYWRVASVVAILDGLGTLIVPFVHALLYRNPVTRIAPAYAAPAYATPAYPPAAPQPAPQMPAAASSYVPDTAPTASVRLAWPRYEDGRPVARKANGDPDFTGVYGF